MERRSSHPREAPLQWPAWLPSVLLLAALLVLRLFVVNQLHLPLPDAFAQGLLAGGLSDCAIVLLAVGLARLLDPLARFSRLTRAGAWPLLASTLYLSTFSNVGHVLFFRRPLEWSDLLRIPVMSAPHSGLMPAGGPLSCRRLPEGAPTKLERLPARWALLRQPTA